MANIRMEYVWCILTANFHILNTFENEQQQNHQQQHEEKQWEEKKENGEAIVALILRIDEKPYLDIEMLFFFIRFF